MGNEATVLVVEDELLVGTDIKRQLTKLGYQVLGPVPDGEASVAIARESRPDLVLMDIRLKGDTDGIDAAHTIRDQTEIPVVFLTAYTDEPTLKRAKEAQPYGYIRKPFEAADLRAGIEVAVHKWKAERAAARAKEQERLVSEKAHEIEMLEAIHRLKADVVESTAHDLRTPLTSIRAALYTMSRQLKDADEPVRQALDIASRNTERLVDRIEKLIDVTRANADQWGVRQQPFDAAATVRKAVQRLVKDGAQITMDADRPVRVTGDPDRFEQVVIQLLTNAVKDSSTDPVSVIVHQDGEAATVFVATEGVGFTEEDVGRLFHPSMQRDADGAEDSRGRGVGLYVSRRFMELMGGKIGVESDGPEHGARFHVSLPLAPSSDGHATPA